MNELQEEAPRKVGDPPKELHAESNPERQGPEGDDPSPADAPAPGDDEEASSGPPPESIPGDSGEVPNRSQN